MPKYTFHCSKCHKISVLDIRLSTYIENPDKIYKCDCGHTMRRAIKNSHLPTVDSNIMKEFAGDWFKKEYGHEIDEVAQDKAAQKRDRETLERELRKEL